MSKEKVKTIKINNFNIASLLVYEGYELLELEKDPTSPIRQFFVFPYFDNFEILISSFWNKELRVEPFAFVEAQRYLKSRLHTRS